MPFNTSGAASGAAAGASFGPWGALIGGVAGGFLGGGGDAPQPAYIPPPQAIGGIYNQFGSVYQDPSTGAVYQYGNQPNISSRELGNEALMAALTGQTPTGVGSQEGGDYTSARNALMNQITGLKQRLTDAAGVRGYKDVQGFNQQLDNLNSQLQQLDASHAQAASGLQQNPLLQYFAQNKYNSLADVLNQNAAQGALQQQQALANRGLAGSTLSDMNARQAALQHGTALSNLLQGVGQQDLSARMGLLGQLQGQNQAINQERLGNEQMGLGYNEFGAGLAQNFANAMMGRNAANVGLQNAGNWAQYGQQQRNAGDLGSAIGSVDWSRMFGSGSSGQPSSSTQGFAGPAPAYSPSVGSATSNYGAGFGNYMTNLSSSNPFQVNMSAAGKGR